MAREFCLSIELGFRSHTKTRKFCRLMGQNAMAFGHLIALWEWAAEHAPSGDLSRIDIEEIEDGVGHLAGDGRCYRALVNAGFIDEGSDGARSIHNWMKPGRTGYALARMEAERLRWRRAKGIRVDSQEIPGGFREESSGNLPGEIREEAGIPSSLTVHGSEKGVVVRSVEPDVALQPEHADPSKAPEPELWPAHLWLRRFSAAWCRHYQAIAYGNPGDSKATGELADHLETIPKTERVAAQARSGAMFSEYLADCPPVLAKARHPWALFVMRFGGLRVPAKASAASPRGSPPVSRSSGNVGNLAEWLARKESET